MIFCKLDGGLAITFHSPDNNPYERMKVYTIVDNGDMLEMQSERKK